MVNIVEYWRGLDELKPMIYMGDHYESLDPDAFYVGWNADVEGDNIDPVDLRDGEKQVVMTYNAPGEPGVERELYVDQYQAHLMEVT